MDGKASHFAVPHYSTHKYEQCAEAALIHAFVFGFEPLPPHGIVLSQALGWCLSVLWTQPFLWQTGSCPGMCAKEGDTEAFTPCGPILSDGCSL